MVDWSSLQHAYGPADDVPALLAAAEASDAEFGGEWDEAWGHLCHQGTVYSASYPALPLLRSIAERRPPSGYLAALGLAACIISSTDGPRDPGEVRFEFAEDIEAMQVVALRCLGLATSDVEFVYGLEALLAFEGGGVLQRALTYLADGEVPLVCPRCGELVVVDPTTPAVRVFSGPGGTTPVAVAEPVPGSVEARMLELAREHGRDQVALQIKVLAGRTSCPKCGADFEVLAGVREYDAGE